MTRKATATILGIVGIKGLIDISKTPPNIRSATVDIEVEKRKIIFQELNNLIKTMFNFNVSQSTIHQNIIKFSKAFNISYENVQTLLCDLGRYHQIVITDSSSYSEIMFAQSKKEEKMNKYKDCLYLIILKYVIHFLKDNIILTKILCLNQIVFKETNLSISKILYFNKSKDIQRKNLTEFWILILKANYSNLDYFQIKREIVENNEAMSNVFSTIKCDIEITYNEVKGEVISEKLINILMTYAYTDKDVQYCQGMNFIAGLIFHVVKSEELTFRLFYQLINLKQMKLVFSDETPLLRELLYQLDKLIYLYFPDLALHFKV